MENQNQNDRDLSFILDDGSLVETIYDPAKKTTAFAIGGKADNIDLEGKPIPIEDSIVTAQEINVDGQTVKPIKPNNEMLKLGFIKLPSGVELYGSPLPETTDEARNKFLFSSIKTYLKKYVGLPEEFYEISALYIMFSWLYEKFSIVPYLRVVGGFGTGKSRFLQVVGSVCRKPMFFNGATSVAGIFRTIDWFKGSVVFDESDFKNSDLWSNMVKVLNSGHEKNSPVLKMEPKKDGQFVPKAFYIFGPKIFASRERFADEALESRCLTQRLHYVPTGSYPIILPENFDVHSGQLRKWLLMFRFKNYHKIIVEEVPMPMIQTARIKQTLSGIAIIAKLLGDDVLDRVLKFGKGLDDELRSQMRDSAEVEVLLCLLEMLKNQENAHIAKKELPFLVKLTIKDLAGHYNRKFYSEYNDTKDKSNFYENNYTGESRLSVYANPKVIVSPKRIGKIVSKLGFRKLRGGGSGYYIPASEFPKILQRGQAFGITDEMLDIRNPEATPERDEEMPYMADEETDRA